DLGARHGFGMWHVRALALHRVHVRDAAVTRQERLENLLRHRRRRDAADRLARARAPAARSGAHAELRERRVIRVRRAEHVLHVVVVRRDLVFVPDDERDGRAERDAVLEPREAFDLVLFLARRADLALARLAAVEPALHFYEVERVPGRAA